MTFDDDLLILQMPSGPHRVRCTQLGIQWPPPTTLRLRGFEAPFSDIDFRLLRMSAITDDQRASMTHVCRAAEYVYASKGLQ